MTSLYVLFILLSYVFTIIKLIKSYNDRVLNVGLIREKWFEYKSRSKWALILDLVLAPLAILVLVEVASSNRDMHQDTSTVWGWFQSFENPTSIYSIQFVIVVMMIVVVLFFEIKESNASTIISREGILAVDGEIIPWNRVEEVEEGYTSDRSLNKVVKITVKAKRQKTRILKLIVPKDEFKDFLIATRNAINLNRDE
ncbi:hypothetical protein [Clostridium folliculivorans]|uniref:DUF5673 domain-containing protein n=1 Tax=Clostridium folliculivorans TaxID=2886038 RepID=A0A9W5Y6S1_9CLOT|nr:hypothetical protein [Clostridium folliculivorans]GKU27686.1 hypothetical protein CFOLD11_45130 [Clostridium folliculivorans]GKU32446.1 hypothetical protein CFB3_45540 [Clostridium folliculivorans]